MKGVNVWFQSKKEDLMAIPIGWKGWGLFGFFALLNIFSFWYFFKEGMMFDEYLKIGVVFLLSVFIVLEFIKYKTRRRK